jgi:hypothetical protein
MEGPALPQGFVGGCAFETDQIGLFVDRILQDRFQVVEGGLGHVDGVNAGHFTDLADEMVAPAAEVDAAPAEFAEQTLVVRPHELIEHARRKVRRGVVAQHDLAAV